VPEHRAIMLDGGDVKRVMFVDWKDESRSAQSENELLSLPEALSGI
jgi:hypothetical protein